MCPSKSRPWSYTLCVQVHVCRWHVVVFCSRRVKACSRRKQAASVVQRLSIQIVVYADWFCPVIKDSKLQRVDRLFSFHPEQLPNVCAHIPRSKSLKMSSSKTDPPLRVLTPRLAESRPNSPSSVDRKTGSAETVDTVSHEGPPSSHGRGAAFWVVFASLSLMALLSAMEGGIMSTALPSISRAVNAEGNYVWIVNVYVLARYVSPC